MIHRQPRYTETRLAAISHAMLAEIGEETVEFIGNFDNSQQEPTVLPAQPLAVAQWQLWWWVWRRIFLPHNLGKWSMV